MAYETHKSEAAYGESTGQMTREVVAACEAVYEAGANEIVVKDGHGDAANIDPFCMPDYVTLIRGKSGHPYSMVSGLDDSLDGVMYIGYHTPVENPGFAISHTSTGNSLYTRLNGSCMSEFMLNNYTAASYGISVLFLSGDRTICSMTGEMVPAITTAMTKTGLGASTYCKTSEQVEESIHQGVKKAMAGSLSLCKIALPETFTYEVTYRDWKKVYQMSFYPGMRAVGTFTNRLETSRWMDMVTVHCFVVYQSVKEITAIDIGMFGKISDTFDLGGFREGVVHAMAGYCGRHQVENDAMNNLYVRMPGVTGDRPVVQLGAHLDEYDFMVQCIHNNGCLEILVLGGPYLTSFPAHTVVIKARAGKKARGIIMSKSAHFMNDRERAFLEPYIENLYVDIGAASRREVGGDFGVSIGGPMIPEVSLLYDGEHGLRFGKAFDNRASCTCVVDIVNKIHNGGNELVVGMVGVFAVQKEMGMRDVTVTTQVVGPDLAILFEGSLSDDFFLSVTQAQGETRNGVQIRRMDKSYISNPVFMECAMELADKFDIRYQEVVRRGDSTSTGRISLIRKAVPAPVLGVLSRYIYSHYNFYAEDDLEAVTELATQVIGGLDPGRVRHIPRQDVL